MHNLTYMFCMSNFSTKPASRSTAAFIIARYAYCMHMCIHASTLSAYLFSTFQYVRSSSPKRGNNAKLTEQKVPGIVYLLLLAPSVYLCQKFFYHLVYKPSWKCA